VNFSDAEFGGGFFRRGAVVAGQQEQPGDSAAAEFFDRLFCIRLQRVGDFDAAEEAVSFGDTDGGTVGADRGGHGDSGLFEQPGAADPDLRAVDAGADTASGSLLDFPDPGGVGRSLPRVSERKRNRVVRMQFGQCGEFEHPFRLHPVCREDFTHFEFPPGQRSGLVEGDRADRGERFDVTAPFEEDSAPRRPADSGEERQRHRDHQRAGAGDDQEHQRPVNPDRPLPAERQRRQRRQQQRRTENRRRVDAGEPGDEVFAFRLAVGGVLHLGQNPAHRGVGAPRGHFDFEQPGAVDCSAENRVAGNHGTRPRFPGQRRRVELRHSGMHHPVQRNALPGPHDDVGAGLHLLRRDGAFDAVLQQIGEVGADVHQIRDRTARPFHRQVLEIFADMEKEHDGGRLGVLPDRPRPGRRQRHQQIFVEQVAGKQLAQRVKQHPPPRNQIDQREQPECDPLRNTDNGQNPVRCKQRRRYTDDRQRKASARLLMVVFVPVQFDFSGAAGAAGTAGIDLFFHSSLTWV